MGQRSKQYGSGGQVLPIPIQKMFATYPEYEARDNIVSLQNSSVVFFFEIGIITINFFINFCDD
jgi:hypothetical protein